MPKRKHDDDADDEAREAGRLGGEATMELDEPRTTPINLPAPEVATRAQSIEREMEESLVHTLCVHRLIRYRPDSPAHERRDLICLCCGDRYRPEDEEPIAAMVCFSCRQEAQGF